MLPLISVENFEYTVKIMAPLLLTYVAMATPNAVRMGVIERMSS